MALDPEFRKWYDSISFAGGEPGEWWKDQDDVLGEHWHELASNHNVPVDVIEDIFTSFVYAISAQYGD